MRDGYIAGVPCWVDTSQPDPKAAVDFYAGLFGWEFENVMPAGSGGSYFIARLGGGDVAAVGSVPDQAPPVASWNTYVWVDSADEAATSVRGAGGNVVTEPFDVMDFGRMAVFTDPEERRSASGRRSTRHAGGQRARLGELQRPPRTGSGGARSFYGSVFGWKTLALGRAWRPGRSRLRRLPRTRRPDLRQRMKDAQAPEGFEDVVATLNPIGEGQADAALGRDLRGRRCRRHGGEGREARRRRAGAALRAPWVRLTVLRPTGGDVRGQQVRAGERGLTTHRP